MHRVFYGSGKTLVSCLLQIWQFENWVLVSIYFAAPARREA